MTGGALPHSIILSNVEEELQVAAFRGSRNGNNGIPRITALGRTPSVPMASRRSTWAR